MWDLVCRPKARGGGAARCKNGVVGHREEGEEGEEVLVVVEVEGGFTPRAEKEGGGGKVSVLVVVTAVVEGRKESRVLRRKRGK